MGGFRLRREASADIYKLVGDHVLSTCVRAGGWDSDALGFNDGGYGLLLSRSLFVTEPSCDYVTGCT